MDSLYIRGKFAVEHWYRGKLIGLYPCHNDTTNEGKNRFLNISFHKYTAITSWYMSLIDNVGYTAVAATDIYTNIGLSGNTWSEFSSYTDTNNGENATTRPLWLADPASGPSIANTTKILFTSTAVGVVKGIFVVGGSANAQVKNDNSSSNSIIWATALFDTPFAVFIGSLLKTVYTINA